jgi:DNA replication protein DnaC
MSDTNQKVPCPRCQALGEIDPYCHRCEGSGEVCPICKGMGYVYTSPPGRGSIPCSCGLAYRRQSQALVAVSALRGRLLECRFNNFSQEGRAEKAREALQAAGNWAKDPVGWLVIYGGKGNGKTHLAAAAANYLIAQGQPVLFVNVPEFLDWLRESYSRPSFDDTEETFAHRFELVRDAPVLILDDLGAESDTAWANEKLYMLLNYRLEMRLPTMITSNLRFEDFPGRLRSRLGEVGFSVLVHNKAPDYRLRTGQVTL